MKANTSFEIVFFKVFGARRKGEMVVLKAICHARWFVDNVDSFHILSPVYYVLEKAGNRGPRAIHLFLTRKDILQSGERWYL